MQALRSLTLAAVLSTGCLTLGNQGPAGEGGGGNSAEADPEVFEVTATLTQYTCGTGQLSLDETWEFYGRLSVEDGKGVEWDWGEGVRIGKLTSSSGSFSVSSSIVVNMRTQDEADWMPPCSIQRTDDLTGKLDSTDDPRAFEGSLVFNYLPTSGSDCEDLLLGDDRILETLPCTATYQISAVSTAGEAGGGGSGGAGGSGGDGGDGGAGGD